MEPHHHTSSPLGPVRSTHPHLAQFDQATTTATTTTTTTAADSSTPTEPHASRSSKQQPSEDDPSTSTTTTLRKQAASTATLSSPSSPSSPPAHSQPSSPALSSVPLLTRIPGTPPTNPPPRFFTRPYRRPIDHSHHHGSAHGAGYLNSQGSASLGVRSAFKDFVVPAQIILFFSILNALWPTLLRIVTTTIEFLVLVLSSYSACARNSDNCYFLEPLLPDGQEGAYAVTIQWTLRITFCCLFFGGFAIISKRMEKVWSTLLSNRQRPRSFWSPDNVVSWILSCPGALWSYIERLLPWKISRSFRQSTPTRSGQRHRRKASGLQSDDQYYSSSAKSRANSISSSFRPGHDPRRVNASSCVDTDTISAGSGSESRPRSKKSKKPRVPEESSLREMSSMPRSPLYSQASPSQPTASESSGRAPSTEPSLEATAPIDSKTVTPTPINSDITSAVDAPTTSTSGAQKSEKSDAGIASTTSANSGIVYETADDDDFISTDRRRRRRAKGLKTNLDAHSSETLIKPIPCPQEENEANSNDQSNLSTGSIRSSPAPDAPKAMTNSTNKNNNSSAALTQSTPHPTSTAAFTSASQDGHTPQKAMGTQSQHLPPSGNHHQRQESKTRNQHQKSASQGRRKEVAESHSKTPLIPTPPNSGIPSVTSTSASLDSTPETTFVHPLHALNSSSPIVRLKPSHKRSQSAQLPSVSPWSIPHSAAAAAAAAGSTSGASHSKLAGGSSLSQMTLPVNLITEHVDPYTTSSNSSTTTPATTATLPETNKLETSGSGEYDLFGPSSGWYSPFQSGLDITIESDQEKGRHGSRSLTRPRVKVDAAALQSPSRPSLGPLLPPSSFFESSPRTPRIMPFSQHYRGDSLGFGSAAGAGSGSGSISGSGIGMGLSGNEDWSVRTRSSSIAAPMTPLLEADCVDPMDYFGGSRSASSSRRGSVENNLTESLLSGRARMFASSDSSFGSTRLSQTSIGAGQQSMGASGSMNQPSLQGNNSFLSPHHFNATISSRIQAAAGAHSSASNSPVLGGQRALELPVGITNSTVATPAISTNSSGTGSLLSDGGFESTTNASPRLSGFSGAMGSTSASTSSSTTAFVNPWESNYPYKSSSHTMSDTFLPFGLVSSSLNNSSTNLDHQFQADQDRQSSLLRLMNGSGGSNIDLGHGGDMDSRIGSSQLQQHQRDDIESEAIQRGFLFPNLAHHTGVGSTSSLPLLSADLSGGNLGRGSGSMGGFHPFASVEMSLAAVANQPPPPLQEEPMYDFVELSIPDLSRNRQGAGLEGFSSTGAAGSLSSAGGLSSSTSSSLTGAGTFRGTGWGGGGAETGERKHRERGARHGRSRSGHHKSASLGSFFPPIPPATTSSSSSLSGGGDHYGSPGIQGNSAGGTGLDTQQSGRHHNHGHSRLGRGSSGGGKDGESRRSRASTGAEQQDISGSSGGGGGSHSRGTSRHFDGSNGNSRAKRAPKKDHHNQQQQQSSQHHTQHQNQNQNQQSGVLN